VNAKSMERSDDSNHSFYEALEQVFNHLPKCHMKILLGVFNTKLRREDIYRPAIGNASPHHDSNDNGVKIVNFT
jgi:hypothetical protein